MNVTFAISLDGSFEDIKDITHFLFYKKVELLAIKPRHGPKDGGTIVQVWGKNFLDFADESVCAFGVRSVKAKVHNDGYLTCTAP